MDPSGYGAVLRAARKSLRLSVAKASGLVRVSPATIKRWESGKGLPPKSELRGYLDRLGVSTSSPVREAIERAEGPSGRREAQESLADRTVLRLLRAKRRRNEITLTELSQVTGLSVASLFRYETGERAPDEDTLRSIALAVGCTEAETDGLVRSLFSPSRDQSAVTGLAERFLVPDNLTQLHVFELLDSILHGETKSSSDPWEAFHGLLIMGEHDTVREVWPALKPTLNNTGLSLENRVLFRTTLATVKSTFEPVDPALLERLGPTVVALRPGTPQMMAMLHLARLAMAAGDLEQANTWINKVEEFAVRVGDTASLYLAELNRCAVEFESSRSEHTLLRVKDLQASATGSLQSYNVDVALSHMHALVGDEESTAVVLESCARAESTYGFGSPLARKLRKKLKE